MPDRYRAYRSEPLESFALDLEPRRTSPAEVQLAAPATASAGSPGSSTRAQLEPIEFEIDRYERQFQPGRGIRRARGSCSTSLTRSARKARISSRLSNRSANSRSVEGEVLDREFRPSRSTVIRSIRILRPSAPLTPLNRTGSRRSTWSAMKRVPRSLCASSTIAEPASTARISTRPAG